MAEFFNISELKIALLLLGLVLNSYSRVQEEHQ